MGIFNLNVVLFGSIDIMTECKTISSLTLNWFAVYLGKLQKYNNYNTAKFANLCIHIIGKNA